MQLILHSTEEFLSGDWRGPSKMAVRGQGVSIASLSRISSSEPHLCPTPCTEGSSWTDRSLELC